MKKAPAKKISTEKIKKALNNNKIRNNKTMLNKIKWFTAKIVNKIDNMDIETMDFKKLKEIIKNKEKQIKNKYKHLDSEK